MMRAIDPSCSRLADRRKVIEHGRLALAGNQAGEVLHQQPPPDVQCVELL
jgi:hypothetical protein